MVDLKGGDLLFLISSSEIVTKQQRRKFRKTLLIHASDLPNGRGWNPHIWEIINGAPSITITLLEAVDKVDSGDIWKKITVPIPATALFDEINRIIFRVEMELMDFAISNFDIIRPEAQSTEVTPSYWSKREPKDSEIDIHKSIDSQFNLIRVCDPDRYPSFFYKEGKKFLLKLEAIDD
jgi:methionyl-tRNA formyltransferase